LENPNDSETLNIGNTIWAKTISHGTPGSVGIGVKPSLIAERLHVGGNVLAAGTIKSNIGDSTGGIGYATGAGGTVTQLTSKATTVALTKMCGTIITPADSIAAGATVSFQMNNGCIAATDVVIANIASGGTLNGYSICVVAVGASMCRIQLRNVSAGPLAEALTINFLVIKGVVG